MYKYYIVFDVQTRWGFHKEYEIIELEWDLDKAEDLEKYLEFLYDRQEGDPVTRILSWKRLQ